MDLRHLDLIATVIDAQAAREAARRSHAYSDGAVAPAGRVRAPGGARLVRRGSDRAGGEC